MISALNRGKINTMIKQKIRLVLENFTFLYYYKKGFTAGN